MQSKVYIRRSKPQSTQSLQKNRTCKERKLGKRRLKDKKVVSEVLRQLDLDKRTPRKFDIFQETATLCKVS